MLYPSPLFIIRAFNTGNRSHMAKRRLTVQQQRRIAQKQQNAATSASETRETGADRLSGLVVTRFGKQADVQPLDSTSQDAIQRCHIRANINDVVTGDRVIWRNDENGAVIESVLPRDSELCRPDPRGKLRPVAANVDRIAIVIAPEPRPHSNLIDRYLVAAEAQGIRAMLILNKADLELNGELEELLRPYETLGYELYRVSARTGDGMDSLLACLAEHTTVLVGQSGVGKSSLVNKLLPSANAKTGELSEQMAKGRHTTTAATLYPLSAGGFLIDSPGIREFGLWHMDAETVATGFIEFRPYLGHCRFRDCNHLNQAGCAIMAEVDAKTISAERYLSYRQIVSDLSID